MLMLQKSFPVPFPPLLFSYNLLKSNLLVMTLRIFFMVMLEGRRALEPGMPSMFFLPASWPSAVDGCNEAGEQKCLQPCFLEYALSEGKEQLCCLEYLRTWCSTAACRGVLGDARVRYWSAVNCSVCYQSSSNLLCLSPFHCVLIRKFSWYVS